MLVPLYSLPDISELKEQLKGQGILLRQARAYERHIVAHWVACHFSPKWVSETKIAFSRTPISCFIATKDKEILGFACVDVTAKGFLGPMGVAEKQRSAGLGKALLVEALHHLSTQGYAYGVIGGVGPSAFYEKAVGAIPIPMSTPGIYQDILPDPTV